MALSKILPASQEQYAGARNLIINGAMQVYQRGSQAGVRNTYGVDRFKLLGSGSQLFTYSQSTTVPSGEGFSYSAKLDVTTADTSVAAGDYQLMRYIFEGQDLQHLKYGTSGAKSLTLQFWVRSPKTGTHIVELDHADAGYFNSQSYTIAAADTWQKVTLTFDGYQTTSITNDNTDSFRVTWWLMAGSTFSGGTLASNTWQNTSANRAVGQVNVVDSTSNEFYLTGVQLEVGEKESPFQHERYEATLRKCQRYYYPAGAYNIYAGWAMTWGGATQYPKVNADFPVAMRAIPTITYANSNTGAANQIEWIDGSTTGASSWGVGVHGMYFVFTSSNISANFAGQFRYTADAEL